MTARIKLLPKHINNTKLCGRWIRWSMVGHLLWTTMWLQPSAGPVSIHRSHSLAFCCSDWRPRSASWTPSLCPTVVFIPVHKKKPLHLSVSAPALLLQITAQTSRAPLSREGHTNTHTHTHTHTKLNYGDGTGRGSEREIGQSACTPPLLNPPHCPGWTGKWGRQGDTHTHKHTHVRTHTHTTPDGEHVCLTKWNLLGFRGHGCVVLCHQLNLHGGMWSCYWSGVCTWRRLRAKGGGVTWKWSGKFFCFFVFWFKGKCAVWSLLNLMLYSDGGKSERKTYYVFLFFPFPSVCFVYKLLCMYH